ncbi:hypothetical protein CTI12_AA130470 [Artemisia annua]|uniref:PB1-like domain-containing protein n=1 Tax=Artemisia annua TaxID=35608 RepID=A0A2U1PLW7_ARTAN|nr:hypothetical protein CTI12_AA130470 [Artemisia annua]
MFTLEIHHNGQFTSTPGRIYLFGDTDWFDGIHCDIFSMGLLGEMLEDLGYTDRTLVYTHFRLPRESLDDGLLPLKSDEDVKTLVEYVPFFTQLELYIETGVSIVECEMMDRMMTKRKGVVNEEIVDDDVNEAAGKGVDDFRRNVISHMKTFEKIIDSEKALDLAKFQHLEEQFQKFQSENEDLKCKIVQLTKERELDEAYLGIGLRKILLIVRRNKGGDRLGCQGCNGFCCGLVVVVGRGADPHGYWSHTHM